MVGVWTGTVCALVTLSLHGCGGEEKAITTTMDASTPKDKTTLDPGTTGEPTLSPYTTAPPKPGKTPLYVVMRMDDVNPVDKDDVLADVITWFVEHKVKFNFGIIVGSNPADPWSPYWPTTCAQNPEDMYCDSKTVQAVQKAYDNDDIVGTSPDAVLEMGSHAWDHDNWARQMDAATQDADFKNATTTLSALYPKASIKYFAAPENVADKNTIDNMKKHGMSILSAAATRSCGSGTDPMEAFYLTSPCQDMGGQATCEPENDVWATTDGFAQVDGIFSAPAGSANSHWTGGGQEGVSVKRALGKDDCGCHSSGSGSRLRVWCSVVGSARNNAAKSNGLHWTVHMMHPQTQFPDHKKYSGWLTEFHREAMALEDWDVRFINFQDLARISAPGTFEGVTV